MKRSILAFTLVAQVASAAPSGSAEPHGQVQAPVAAGDHRAVPAPPREKSAHPATPAAAVPPGMAAVSHGVRGSKHDFSRSGPGPIKAVSESDTCKFCHVSHMGAAAALGNRPDDHPSKYQRYASSTLESAPGAPSQSTRMCLSCHDGTIAIGKTLSSGRIEMQMHAGGDARPDGFAKTSIGTDLRRSHPVSVRPPMTAKVRAPSPEEPARLAPNGEVECTSCHDPHREDRDPVQRKFLVGSNRESALCLSCHRPDGWTSNPSAHRTSTRPFGPMQGVSGGYGTVADSGCASCHQQHGADERGRLLASGQSSDDRLCLRCHDGRVARLDIAREVTKPAAHAAAQGASGHDAAEGPYGRARLPEVSAAAKRHATCVDCHNPHAAFAEKAQAPLVGGALASVWGIDRNGLRVEKARYEYEICFKCHADSANQPQARGPLPPETLRRAVTELNLRRALDLSAPSFHPIEGQGRNVDVPSLIAPLTTASVIACSDCHASDTTPSGGPRGPHGSTYAHLLERNLSTLDHTPESAQAYALCYKCHSRDVLLSERSGFTLHRRHVVDQGAPCTACHASHGVSALQGNPVNNAHLVNFDVSIVRPSSQGLLQYTTRGSRSGSCALSCHGKDHAGGSDYGVASSALRIRLPGAHKAVAAPPRPRK